MKTFIIAAMSADGYIAKEVNHPAFWTSKEDKKRFVELTQKAGIVVMGLNTYRTLHRPLKERINVVYSPDPIEGVETTTKPPKELLAELESRGFKEVAICGGSMVYSMFMKSGLVDYLYLTVEPILFGDGMRLFQTDFHYHLKLISTSQAENGALLLEYKVDYSGSPKGEIGSK
jgi:dihydrofolate reductase